MTFVATHTVGGDGAATWETPDAAAPPAPRLEPWLPVHVLQRWGDWAQVRCENGWETWTDGRVLSPLATRATTNLARALPPFGGVLAVAGSLLPWFSLDDFSINAWDIPAWGLISSSPNAGGPSVGLLVGLAGLAAVAAVLPVPWLLLAVGALATGPAAYAIFDWLMSDGLQLRLGVGAVLSLAGGATVMSAAWRSLKARREGSA